MERVVSPAARMLILWVAGTSLAGAAVDPLGITEPETRDFGTIGVPPSPDVPSQELEFEEMRYSAEKAGVPVGRALFRARDTAQGKELRVQFCTTGLVNLFHSVRYQLYSRLEESGTAARPDYHRLTHIQGGTRKETVVEFNGGGTVRIEKHREGSLKKVRTKPVPEGIQENLSVIYRVRALPLEVGETYRLPLLDEEDVETLVVPVKERTRVMGAEVLKIAPYTIQGGKREEGSQWALFLTDDPRRIPLRIHLAPSIGDLQLDLERYRDQGGVDQPQRMFCDPDIEVPS